MPRPTLSATPSFLGGGTTHRGPPRDKGCWPTNSRTSSNSATARRSSTDPVVRSMVPNAKRTRPQKRRSPAGRREDDQHADARVVHRQLFPPLPIVVNPPRAGAATAIEVSVVDERTETSIPWYNPARFTGPLANIFRGDATMRDAATMATNVLALLRGRSMTQLNVLDHGNAEGIEIGDDWIATVADVRRVAGSLGRLRGKFTAGGFVHLQNVRPCRHFRGPSFWRHRPAQSRAQL